MSYEVLAQKWRPQNFSDVVGQAHVTTTLKNQILSKRIGHAYLFWGPRGTGKTTIARILAKAVNCPNRHEETEFDTVDTAEPCNTCESCSQISTGRSMDVLEMDAASNRGIDTIRDLRENVKLSPSTSPYKVYIIDEVHMLSGEAFNALLKTLEEPPPHVIFIMATTEHARIPKTISSRCQDFDFRHLEDEKVIDRLLLIVETEGISADREVLALITRQSEGCLRDAENLLERLVSSAGKRLTLETVEQAIGLGSSSLLQELTEAITERELTQGLKTLNSLTKQGTDLSQCVDQVINYFRDIRLLAIDAGLSEQIQSPKSDLPRLKQKAEQLSVNRLSRIIKILMQTQHDIKTYGYPQLQLETALIQLNTLEEGVPLSDILGKLSALEQKFDSAGGSGAGQLITQPAPAPAARQQIPFPEKVEGRGSMAAVAEKQAANSHPGAEAGMPSAPAPSPASQGRRNLAELPAFWEGIRSQLPARLRYGLPEGVIPKVNSANTVEIQCRSTSMINAEDKKIVADALTEQVGHPVEIAWVRPAPVQAAKGSEQAPEKAAPKTPLIRKLEAQDDPQLKTALELFEATVLETE